MIQLTMTAPLCTAEDLDFFLKTFKKLVHKSDVINNFVKKRLPAALTAESPNVWSAPSILFVSKSLDQGSVINPEPKRPALVTVFCGYHKLAGSIVSVYRYIHFSSATHLSHPLLAGLGLLKRGERILKKLCQLCTSTRKNLSELLSRAEAKKNYALNEKLSFLSQKTVSDIMPSKIDSQKTGFSTLSVWESSLNRNSKKRSGRNGK